MTTGTEIVKTSFYIEKETLKRIKRRVIEEECSQSEFIRRAIDEALEKEIVRPTDKQVIFKNEN